MTANSNSEVKVAAEQGLNMTAEVRNDITFDEPNETTKAAILEGRKLAYDKNAKGYNDIASLKKALDV